MEGASKVQEDGRIEIERERKRDGEARAKEVPSDVELRSSRATRLGTWACRRACYAIDYAL